MHLGHEIPSDVTTGCNVGEVVTSPSEAVGECSPSMGVGEIWICESEVEELDVNASGRLTPQSSHLGVVAMLE